MRSELLAPAGSYESMKAAYAAGADAVYIGGSRFGARAYADNPDTENLKHAIDYAHIRNKKLYLTVNTLLKDAEMEELYDYLNPFYQEGLDAVIVQDFGVVSMVKEAFPEMEIHASTQMSITTEYGARLLKEMGASRIVTARELSLEEIRKIHDSTDIEIESFIHGALCYCYSGQCLFSSMLGGRSGNRGRCAQPCRLPYDLSDLPGKRERGKYLLSLKDICTLDILPEILESGVYSLKIEGRMKKPEYTAGVVGIYRKYLDLYEEKGKAYRVSDEDKKNLLDLYNRGGFSSGYYKQQNGPGMMADKRPNHQGTEVAKVLSSDGRCLKIQALETLNKEDVLEIPSGEKKLDVVLKEDAAKKKVFTIKPGAPFKQPENGTILFRTRNSSLLKTLEKNYILAEDPVKINGKLILLKRKSAILNLSCRGCSVSVEGICPEEAKNRPLSQKDVEKQLRKTGGSSFVFENLSIEMEPDLFMPLQGLNELRRKALLTLSEELLRTRKRPAGIRPDRQEPFWDKSGGVSKKKTRLSVSLESTDAVREICKIKEVDAVCLDCNAFKSREDFAVRGKNLAEMCRKAGKSCYYVMPWVFRQKAVDYYSFGDVWQTLLEFDGLLLRSQDEYLFLRERGFRKILAADWNLYTWNQRARKFWRDRGVSFDTVSPELNRQEIRRRGMNDSEMLVYGRQPLMVSAQCQVKNRTGCTGRGQTVFLTDRRKKRFPVKNNCQFCYNTIYNGVVTELSDCKEEIGRMNPFGVRLHFTLEDKAETLSVIQRYVKIFRLGQAGETAAGEFTRGHFERGVE